MSLSIFLIVIFAAFLHALWNAIVKGAGDRTIVLGLVAAGHVIPGFALLAFSAAPSSAAIPYIVASTVIHWGYYALLSIAYRTGDLSIVYPIARGLSPVLIAVGALIWVGEELPLVVWLGVFAVSAGILLLARGVFTSGISRAGLVAAVGVAVVIASYSIVDGVGVRVSGSPMGYIGWLFVSELFVVVFVFTSRWERLQNMSGRAIAIGLFGGVVSGAAYGLVLYAKTQAPLGVVSALRETSVIFAALMGVFWFSEGPRRDRLLAALIVGLGIATIAGVNV
ncbi:DMT family transporter [Litoreibacter halocynthiae]|uniref:DMT family transporter n=1 Tax=Litoreibacter halocynthiae TaxID=1242689 RepID=UPI002492C9C7|nr:DMT family transporter [Litoreibacter halocynthiae]